MPLNEFVGGGGLSSALDNIARRRSSQIGKRTSEKPPGSEGGHRDTFTASKFDLFTPAPSDGETVRIAEYQVEAGVDYAYGYGTVENDPENQGDFSITTLETSVDAGDMEGWIILRSENAAQLAQEFHWRERTETLRNGVKFPEIDMPLIKEDSKLYIEFEYDPDASVALADEAVDATTLDFSMSMTRFPESN